MVKASCIANCRAELSSMYNVLWTIASFWTANGLKYYLYTKMSGVCSSLALTVKYTTLLYLILLLIVKDMLLIKYNYYFGPNSRFLVCFHPQLYLIGSVENNWMVSLIYAFNNFYLLKLLTWYNLEFTYASSLTNLHLIFCRYGV